MGNVSYFTFVASRQCYVRDGGEMARKQPSYSTGKGWFWCSYAAQGISGRDALIDPFPSLEGAEKDAKESFRIREGEQ